MFHVYDQILVLADCKFDQDSKVIVSSRFGNWLKKPQVFGLVYYPNLYPVHESIKNVPGGSLSFTK